MDMDFFGLFFSYLSDAFFVPIIKLLQLTLDKHRQTTFVPQNLDFDKLFEEVNP